MTEGVAALLVVLIAVGFASTGQARAASGLTAQPVLGMPASQVEVVGASPGEGNEVWAQGQIGAVPAPGRLPERFEHLGAAALHRRCRVLAGRAGR